MEIPKVPDNSIVASGPEGLEQVLNELLDNIKKNPGLAKEEHNILYQLGAQKSLIKVDTKEIPFKFYYYDLMGRPATVIVKDVIAKFLWEKCGIKDQYMREKDDKH